MVTTTYRQWVANGRHWKAARPIHELQVWATRHQVPVLGVIGNEDHLRADRPMDHTPYSSTQWPLKLWPTESLVCAIDLKNVQRDGVTLGAAIERQFRAGALPWLKYMNHAGQHIDCRDTDGDGQRFETEHSDDQHVHLSIRTDCAHKGIGDFNPWEETDMPTAQDLLNAPIEVTENMARLLSHAKTGDHRSLANLLQNVTVFSGNAQLVAGGVAKRMIAIEATVKDNAADTEYTLKSITQKLDTVVERLAELVQVTEPEPVPPEPAPKATPATVAAKTSKGKTSA